MNREAFLDRVRQAARAGNQHRVHLQPIPESAGYVGTGGDLCRALAEEIEAVGGQAHVVADLVAARDVLARLIQQQPAASALCWQHPTLERLGLQELLLSLQVIQLDYRTLASCPSQQQRQKMLSADIGITSADWAVAETGTLVVAARPGQERVASLLPPVHIAVVPSQRIVPDLLDLFQQLTADDPDQLPSNIALITGPSKTGDIELQLTTGVHGPGSWHVIVVREGATAAPASSVR